MGLAIAAPLLALLPTLLLALLGSAAAQVVYDVVIVRQLGGVRLFLGSFGFRLGVDGRGEGQGREERDHWPSVLTEKG